MHLAPFEASRLKIGRARYHINAIVAEIEAYAASSALDITGSRPAMPFRQDINFHTGTLPPNTIGLTLGDVIHNLRSALDIMACDVVRLNGKSTKSVYFPFAESAVGLEEQIKRKNFNRSPKEAVDLLRSMKPYKGGNKALRGIHDLDIADKHELVLPVLQGHHIDEIIVGGNVMRGITFANVGTQFAVGPGIEIETRGKVTPVLMFPEPLPFAGDRVVPTLHGLCDLVGAVVEQFAALMSRSEPKAAG